MKHTRVFVVMLAAVLAGMFPGTSAAMAEAKAKNAIPAGIIEGFYGDPWTHETRLDVLDFLKEVGMDAYIYAPKDDPYHREAWREPYPEEKFAELRELVGRAEKNKVKFIFAVSPGLSLHFTGEKGERDFEDLMAKLRTMHAIGVRSFAVFFDDIENKNGAAQAAFLNRAERAIRSEKLSEDPLLTVPVEYFREDMTEDGEVRRYTRAFAEALSKTVDVFYTGDGVAKAPLTAESAREVAALYGRRMTIWWNYPVNDYLEGKWALGAVDGLAPELSESVRGIYYNPMSNWRLSRLSLRTGADYARDPRGYDAERSMEDALRKEFGSLAPAMCVVARHSRHMENSWANIGSPDAPELQSATAAYWQNVEAGIYPGDEVSAIRKELEAIHGAVKELRDEKKGLDEPLRQALEPQLALLEQLAESAQTVLLYAQAREEGNAVIAKLLYRELEKTAKSFDKSDSAEPRISENALGAFVQRAVIQYKTMEK
ncbi:hypothetical protein TAMA11512_06150 [Selenomonas sp. TAMA-11512]|uniref:protein O-GlcNAcase n=1 Tax=Selenomonas sp. TAMA-11512 TaxID=3095337 RepID=UPI003085E178|nr:hypothetical protein TAMA11512_06150 [Selenomonas sp. TAMA-11512]